MAQYEGTVPDTGTITPVDTKDEYPIVSSEHIKGGYRPVSTKSNLTKIPLAHLVPGSLALVVDERKFYYYNPALDDPWAILDVSGSGEFADNGTNFIRVTVPKTGSLDVDIIINSVGTTAISAKLVYNNELSIVGA